EIVLPALEQREAHLLVLERVAQERQVLAVELLLQRDGVRAHHRALAAGRRPTQCRHEITQRLADAGARLDQAYATALEQLRDEPRHLALAGAILVAPQLRRHRATRAERTRDVTGLEMRRLGLPRDLDDHVEPRSLVVHDREADA